MESGTFGNVAIQPMHSPQIRDKGDGDGNERAAFLASMLEVALDFEFARGKDDAVRKHIEK